MILFEKIVLGPTHGLVDGTDPGAVAEALLFYKDVRWVANPNGLRAFVAFAGADALLDLVRSRHLRIEFYPEMFGTQNYAEGRHSFTTIVIHRQGKNPKNTQDYMEEVFASAGLNARETRRFAASISSQIFYHNVNEDFRRGYTFLNAVGESVSAPSYTSRAVQGLIRVVAPDYPSVDGVSYRIEPVGGDTFTISTNVDFPQLNRISREAHDPTHEWTPDGISTYFMSSMFDTHVAGKFASAVMTSPSKAAFVKSRYMRLIDRTIGNLDEAEMFQRTIIPNAGTVRDAINSKERSFNDLLRLLDEATKFKEWLHTQPEDANVLQEYIRSITTLRWLERMPTKSLRFLTANVTGLLNPLVGGAYSVADTFLIDSIVKGWRPSLFVDGALRDFVAG